MARKKSLNLTEAELRLMDVIWEKEKATVAEVSGALPKQLGLAYNTVLTTLRILEDKGYVRHSKPKEGRAFLYRPLVTRETASRSAVRSPAPTATVLGRISPNSKIAIVITTVNHTTALGTPQRRNR